MSRSAHLVSIDEFAALLEDAAGGLRPIVLDVRWKLAQPDGSQDFAAGHIPTARYVCLDDDLSEHSDAQPATAGRHPLPDFAAFTQRIASWGIAPSSTVVVYDDADGMGAARAWWLLRWAGVADVRVLDGGWAAWQAAGHPTESGAFPATAPDWQPEVGTPHRAFPQSPALAVMDAQQAAEWSTDGVLIDARAPERFRGETEPMDPRAGHIPGAVSHPATDNVTGGFWLSDEELEKSFADVDALGEAPVGVYCGSGVTACHNALALAILGRETTLFPASWSGWSSDPQRPAASGGA